MSTVKKPILGITMGDPFGNGPEITVRALAKRSMAAAAPSSSATPPRWSTPRQCTIN